MNNVHTLCEALNVARGTYYNHILRNKRDNVWYRKREEEYRILIHDVFYEFDQIFGVKKIHAILQQRGHRVKKEYVARIMRDLGLSSIRNQSKSTYEFLNSFFVLLLLVRVPSITPRTSARKSGSTLRSSPVYGNHLASYIVCKYKRLNRPLPGTIVANFPETEPLKTT